MELYWAGLQRLKADGRFTIKYVKAFNFPLLITSANMCNLICRAYGSRDPLYRSLGRCVFKEQFGGKMTCGSETGGAGW